MEEAGIGSMEQAGCSKKSVRLRRAAILGAGALGNLIADGIVHDLQESWQLTGIMARTEDHARKAAEEFGTKACTEMEELLATHPEVVIEAAGVAAAAMYGEKILARGCNLILLSAGALADEGLVRCWKEQCARSGSKICVASGAVGGFDILQALRFRQKQLARQGKNEKISLVVDNFKAPASLEGAPGLCGRKLSETEREEVFKGTAREAIAGFPGNVNVAVALACASAGLEETEVSIVSDPSMKENRHSCVAEGAGVRVTMDFASLPDPNNPRSSSLSAWSVLALLESMASPVCFF